MKIAFTTVDLYSGREFLMPWRTVIEVCKVMIEEGYDAQVLTLPVSCQNGDYEFHGIKILTAPREFNLFCRFIENRQYDVLIYPMPWREALKDISAFGRLKCKKVAYFPGGVYTMYNNLTLWKWGGFTAAKPYIIDTLTPYRKHINKLKKLGFSSIVGLSPYTAEAVRTAGFKNALCILPGKDNFELLEDEPEILKRIDLKSSEKYLLFTGAPAAIRGSQVLMNVCKLLAQQKENIKVVFLMRKDIGSNFTAFEAAYNALPNRANVSVVTERVNRNELKTLMKYARGVILPFLVIPSEIPITYFEVLSLGTPIITFKNNGTTEYLKDALLTCKPGDTVGLAENMKRLWKNDDLYTDLSQKALDIMAIHPTWNEVSKQWINLIKE